MYKLRVGADAERLKNFESYVNKVIYNKKRNGQ